MLTEFDAFRDAQKKGLISFEKVDAQAELDRLSAKIIRDMQFAVMLILSPRHVVPVFDGQYVQHQDRPAIGFPRDKYLYWDKVREQRN